MDVGFRESRRSFQAVDVTVLCSHNEEGMPPLSHNLPDARALEHVGAWIEVLR